VEEEAVIRWNSNFPIDRWWRKKHGIPFGSQRHREISFFEQLFEYKEDKLFNELRNAEKYEPDSGQIFKKEVYELNEKAMFKHLSEVMKNAPTTI